MSVVVYAITFDDISAYEMFYFLGCIYEICFIPWAVDYSKCEGKSIKCRQIELYIYYGASTVAKKLWVCRYHPRERSTIDEVIEEGLRFSMDHYT
jgi:hypothetical protein